MNKYKIVISDLDGTLFNDCSVVSEENIKAIKQLNEKGVLFVPSSGRAMNETPKFLLDIPEIRYFTFSNGSVIYDRKENKTYSFSIPREPAKFLLDTIFSFDTLPTVRNNGSGYFDKNRTNEEEFQRYKVIDLHRDVILNTGIFVEDFKNLCYSFDEIEDISVFFSNDEEKDECKKILEENGSFLVAEAFEHNLEIFSNKAGKGNGIKNLCKITGIDINNCIAVGDSMNDYTMVKESGLGLATSNATSELKAIAVETICSNNEHIVKYIFENYIK